MKRALDAAGLDEPIREPRLAVRTHIVQGENGLAQPEERHGTPSTRQPSTSPSVTSATAAASCHCSIVACPGCQIGNASNVCTRSVS